MVGQVRALRYQRQGFGTNALFMVMERRKIVSRHPFLIHHLTSLFPARRRSYAGQTYKNGISSLQWAPVV
jgi:hypothetical protein